MTTDQTVTDEIRAVLGEFAEINVDRDLVRTSDLGTTLDFSGNRHLFEDIKTFSTSLAELSWENLPGSAQQETRDGLDRLSQAIDAIKEFSSAQHGESDRDAWASQLRQEFDAFKHSVIPFAGYLLWTSVDLEQYRQDLGAISAEARKSAEESLRVLEERKSESDQVLASIRSAAAEAGVSQEAATFREAAQRYDKVAKRWLFGALAGVVVTIGTAFALLFAWGIDGQINEADVLQIVLAKAAALAVLAYGTVTTIRLYRSNAHLAVVNRHREDSLRTFRTFVEGTEDSEIKDKVLLAAAHAAFGQTATGLIGERGDGSNALEVLDGVWGSLIRRP